MTGWQTLSFEDLCSAFPDQHTWLIKLHKHIRCSQYRAILRRYERVGSSIGIKQITETLNYKLPIELLTMCLCFAGDPALQVVPSTFLQDQQKQIKKLSEQYEKQHGQWPHLAVVAELALEQSDHKV